MHVQRQKQADEQRAASPRKIHANPSHSERRDIRQARITLAVHFRVLAKGGSAHGLACGRGVSIFLVGIH